VATTFSLPHRIGVPLSAMLDLRKRAADRCRRFAGRIADQFRMAGRENQLKVARVMNVSHPLQVDFAGKPVSVTDADYAARACCRLV
jgi:hypothetical protein